jgi:hypothetical protein
MTKQPNKDKFAALLAELEAIINTESILSECKHKMVFSDGLAEQIREAGLISQEVPEPASNETEVVEFYDHCKKKLAYLNSNGGW